MKCFKYRAGKKAIIGSNGFKQDRLKPSNKNKSCTLCDASIKI